MKLKEELTIIYSTCDEYKCLWPGFFTLLNKYWPNCDCDIILNTETQKFEFNNFNISEPLYCSKLTPWSTRLYNSLQKVKTEYVLLMLDDFYLKSMVDTKAVQESILQMNLNNQIQSFVYAWQPGPNKNSEFNRFEKRGRFTPYRVNAQIGIWRVDYLKKIIRLNESPWEFEINGSFRSSIIGGNLYSIKKGEEPIFDYDFGFLIIRGKINEELLTYYSEFEKIEIDSSFEIYNKERTLDNNNSIGKVLRYLKYLYRMVASISKT